MECFPSILRNLINITLRLRLRYLLYHWLIVVGSTATAIVISLVIVLYLHVVIIVLWHSMIRLNIQRVSALVHNSRLLLVRLSLIYATLVALQFWLLYLMRLTRINRLLHYRPLLLHIATNKVRIIVVQQRVILRLCRLLLHPLLIINTVITIAVDRHLGKDLKLLWWHL